MRCKRNFSASLLIVTWLLYQCTCDLLICRMMIPLATLATLVMVCCVLVAGALGMRRDDDAQCERITVPMCQTIPYNMTSMPNGFHDATQEEASRILNDFRPLVDIGCSPDLVFFLCSLHVPICLDNYMLPLPPCRSMCERVKLCCEPIMMQFRYKWPERLSCERLPPYGDPEQLCMDNSPPAESVSSDGRDLDLWKSACPVVIGFDVKNGANSTGDPGEPLNESCTCVSPFVVINTESAANDSESNCSRINKCAPVCGEIYFSRHDLTFAQFWIRLWSLVCSLFAFLTICTFLVNRTRFPYPERPIVFISLCYMMVGVGYAIPSFLGHEGIGCESRTDVAVVRQRNFGSMLCVSDFILVYYFSMAGSLWWVILSFSWFLSTGLGWGQEAIVGHCSLWYHLGAWIVPAIFSLAVFLTSSMDGDPVSGVCSIGNLDEMNLIIFVSAPAVTFLLMTVTFLAAGLLTVGRVRQVLTQNFPRDTRRAEDQLLRFGIFVAANCIPITFVIACCLYEYLFRFTWLSGMHCPCVLVESGATIQTPSFHVFLTKYFMTLIMGVTCNFWVWSRKSLKAWKEVFDIFLHKHGKDTLQLT